MNSSKRIKERLKQHRGGGIDAGLARLSQTARRGVPLSHREIAAACGCSWQLIWLIEQKALKKIKEELERRGLGPELLL